VGLVRGFDCRDFGLLFCEALGEEGVVLALLLLLVLEFSALEGAEVTAALEAQRGNQTLDFRCLSIRLSIRVLLALNLPPNNILPNIVLLAQIEELANLGSPLGTETLGQNDVGQPGDLLVALLDNDEGQDGNIRADDAASHGLALALAGAAGTVARVTVREEEAHTVWEKDTLFHGETLLIVSTRDAENVAFPFVADRVARDFLGDFLVVEDTETLLVIEIDELLGPGCGVGNVQLHA